MLCNCCNCIKKFRRGCQGTISLKKILKTSKKDVKRETKDNLKTYITKEIVETKVKDILSKDITNKNVIRETKDSLKKVHSEADAKEVVSNPKSNSGLSASF